ncbi:MAG: histidine kinase dimerization/phospho-acceptor domain-containing protein [Gemmatimonadaceae bacterium]
MGPRHEHGDAKEDGVGGDQHETSSLAAEASDLWAALLERLAERAAHEIRNPLNGAAVSIEVIRSRLQKNGAEVAGLGSFARSAASELERASRLVEAILAVARPVTHPVDLIGLLRPLTVLYGEITVREGGMLEVLPATGGADITADAFVTESDAVVSRLMAASALESVSGRKGSHSVQLARNGSIIEITVHSDSEGVSIPQAVESLGKEAGINCRKTPEAITILLPALVPAQTRRKQ